MAAETHLIRRWMTSFLEKELSESKKQNGFMFCIELAMASSRMKHFQ